MIRRLMAGILLAVVLAFPPLPAANTPEDTGVFRCLVLGYDDFVGIPDTDPCSAHNAEIMESLFTRFLPEGSRITRRLDGPGSAEELEQLIREVFGEAGEADTALLYLSTHGVTWEEDGERRMALTLSDGEREEGLPPERLRSMLEEIPGRKVLILEACHAGMAAADLQGDRTRLLLSSAAEEESYFWSAESEETGAGYFTSALENALLASEASRLNPDGDGWISLQDVSGRLREIYGASTLQIWPENDTEPLFRMPEDRGETERLLGLRFEETREEEGVLVLQFHFTVDRETRLEYQLTPAAEEGWDFGQTRKMPDRERTGTARGLLSPGEKDRTIRLDLRMLGENGKALLQIVSLRGEKGRAPVLEASRVLCAAP